MAKKTLPVGKKTAKKKLSVKKASKAAVNVRVSKAPSLKAKAKKESRPVFAPGDILAIPLPDSRFAFGKLFRNYGLGIYDFIGPSSAQASDIMKKPMWFHCCIFLSALKSSNWKVIGHEPFANQEAEWAPPMYYQDVISGAFEIRHKDKSRRATASEVAGMSPEIIYSPMGLILRILTLLGERR